MAVTQSVPEPGQSVEARRRRYLVSDVRRAASPEDPTKVASPGHLVSLIGKCFEPDPHYGAPSLVVLGHPPTPIHAER